MLVLCLILGGLSISYGQELPNEIIVDSLEKDSTPSFRKGIRLGIGLGLTTAYANALTFDDIKTQQATIESERATNTEIIGRLSFLPGIYLNTNLGLSLSHGFGIDINVEVNQYKAAYLLRENYQDPDLQYHYQRDIRGIEELWSAKAIVLLRFQSKNNVLFRFGGGLSAPMRWISATENNLKEFANGDLLNQSFSSNRKMEKSLLSSDEFAFVPVIQLELGIPLNQHLFLILGSDGVLETNIESLSSSWISGRIGISAHLGR